MVMVVCVYHHFAYRAQNFNGKVSNLISHFLCLFKFVHYKDIIIKLTGNNFIAERTFNTLYIPNKKETHHYDFPI